MELNLKTSLLILSSIVYLFIFQFSIPMLEYYYLFIVGLIFTNTKSIYATLFYFCVGIVSYIFGNEQYNYLLPILTIITNFYTLENIKSSSFIRMVQLFLILLYFASQISIDNYSLSIKIVIINLISMLSIIRIDSFEDSPMKYLFVVIAMHNMGQNLSYITVGTFSILTLLLIPNIITLARFGIVVAWLFLVGEFNLDPTIYCISLSLLSVALISIYKDKKMYLSTLVISLLMFKMNLGLEIILVYITLMLFAELAQLKNMKKLC